MLEDRLTFTTTFTMSSVQDLVTQRALLVKQMADLEKQIQLAAKMEEDAKVVAEASARAKAEADAREVAERAREEARVSEAEESKKEDERLESSPLAPIRNEFAKANGALFTKRRVVGRRWEWSCSNRASDLTQQYSSYCLTRGREVLASWDATAPTDPYCRYQRMRFPIPPEPTARKLKREAEWRAYKQSCKNKSCKAPGGVGRMSCRICSASPTYPPSYSKPTEPTVWNGICNAPDYTISACESFYHQCLNWLDDAVKREAENEAERIEQMAVARIEAEKKHVEQIEAEARRRIGAMKTEEIRRKRAEEQEAAIQAAMRAIQAKEM